MSDKIKKGDVVRHLHLKETPELYVVNVETGSVQCRYFANGIFHLENFVLEEILSLEEASALLTEPKREDQDRTQDPIRSLAM